MCGIFGLFGKEQEFIKELNLDAITCRGDDGFGFSTDNIIFKTKDYTLFKKKLNYTIKYLPDKKTIIIHFLHAIVGNVVQPILSNNTQATLIANCELYNWKQLKKKYQLTGENDAEVLLEMLDHFGIDAEQQIDGVFSYVYWNQDLVILSRDLFGEKPFCYYYDDKTFVFASENKYLQHKGILLDPKQYLVYNIKKHTLEIKDKSLPFVENSLSIMTMPTSKIRAILKQKLLAAFKKRTEPLHKYGILFSGGIDSTLLTYVAKKMKHKFVCYTAAFEDKKTGMRIAPDLEHAKKIARKYDFTLKTKIVPLAQVEKDLPEIITIIESNNPIKVGVALPFYYCCTLAQKDGMKVILSGLGSEELFAGYNRHFEVLKQNNFTDKNNEINKECLKGLYGLWERDLYRDDLITMHHNLELRLPFLDKGLVSFTMRIPGLLKMDHQQKKIILRDVAEEIGLSKEFSQRPKLAAQYGSNFDKALEKLAKKHDCKNKSEYLKQIKIKENN